MSEREGKDGRKIEGRKEGNVEDIHKGADSTHERNGMADTTHGKGIAETKETALKW